ncbi:MAG: hypothetical protein AAF351_05910 [Pseudomonadota bacterium]
MPNLFEEFKRRNVFRVGAAYLAVSWLLLSVADLGTSALRLPEWLPSVVLFILGLLIIPVLIFAWAFELTPEGIKREKDVDRSSSITPETGKKLDYVTLAALAIVLAIVVVDRGRPAATAPVVTEEIVATETEASIAVLPFVDMSPDGDQEYFSDGITEEILNDLAQLNAMKVAGRTSSFAFKGKNAHVSDIGAALNVSHVLEGSVRKAGDRVRITAQLISVEDGFHLWSETYDGDLEDIFQLQDDISEAIVAELKVNLLSDSQNSASTTDIDVKIFDRYLIARRLIHSRTNENLTEAFAMLQEITEAEPNFAPGLSSLAEAAILLRNDTFLSYGNMDPEESRAIAAPLLERAIELEPKFADAYAVRGLMFDSDLQFERGEADLRKAVELNPSLSKAWSWLANNAGSRNNLEEQLEYLQRATSIDPLWLVPNSNLVSIYDGMGRQDDAWEILERLRPFHEDSANFYAMKADILNNSGRVADAIKDYRRAYELSPDTPSFATRLAFSLLAVQKADEAISIAPPQFSVIKNYVERDFDSLLPMLRAELDENPTNGFAIFPYVQGSTFVGDYESVVDLYDRYYAPTEVFANPAYQASAWLFVTPLREMGRDDDAQTMLGYFLANTERSEAQGANNANQDNEWARYYALAGDSDNAIARLRSAVERGTRYAIWDYAFEFESIKDDPRFEEIKQLNLGLINAERAKMGLDPVDAVGGDFL